MDPTAAAPQTDVDPLRAALISETPRLLADAEEIVHEVLSELVEAQRLVTPVRRVGAWLSRVARHRIIDRQGAPADELENAIAALPAELRAVFIAHELEGRSFKELAAATGIRMNTLLGRKHAAVLRLRERLQYIYDELND